MKMEQKENKDKDGSKMTKHLNEANEKIIQEEILICVKIMKSVGLTLSLAHRHRTRPCSLCPADWQHVSQRRCWNSGYRCGLYCLEWSIKYLN